MHLLCPAKINLHLRIGPLRADGFHPLLSWFSTIGLFDTLTLDKAEISPAFSDGSPLSLSCDQTELRPDHPAVPSDQRNLVIKVAQAFAQEIANEPQAAVFPVRAELTKRIPAGAGLGGGSSDAARALAGLNVLWNGRRAASYLSGFAARFGSDLPFFFSGSSSLCTGRGECVTPIAPPAPKWALLLLPPLEMPTGEVYRRFDAMKLGRNVDVEDQPDWFAWSKLNAKTLLTYLVNDLEAPAFSISAKLASMREGYEKLLQRPVRMSGSGSTLFSLYDTADEAEHGRKTVENSGLFDGVRVRAVRLSPDFTDDYNAV